MTESGIVERPRRARMWAAIGVVLAAVMFAGGWAAQAVFSPPENLVDEDVVTSVEVREGSIASYLDISVAATWSVSSSAVNRRSGTITSIEFVSGEPIKAGQTVYTVDLLPVSVAQGAVPMYREIAEDAKGEDVAQLQRMLTGLGHFSGNEDGNFGPITVAAVKAWQKSQGEKETGAVDLGRLIFVPEVPARLTAVEEFQVGDVVSGSEAAFNILNPSATFTASITENQARQLSSDQAVEISSPTETIWLGKTGNITADSESGGYKVAIVPADDGPICGEECESLPVDDSGTSLSARVVLQAELNGAIIPTAAILTRGDGTATVVRVDGEQIEVTVIAGADGQSLVEGVDIGTEVRAPVGGSE